jgi:hypothetical protein
MPQAVAYIAVIDVHSEVTHGSWDVMRLHCHNAVQSNWVSIDPMAWGR